MSARGWNKYRRTNIAEMTPWTLGMDMRFVSVSEVDARDGSPKDGDMIARNPKNHADKWLIAEAYFLDNFEPLPELPAPENNVDAVFSEVAAELLRAEAKHGGMPDDLIHCAAIVGEESGELIRAAIQHTYEGGEISNLRTEAIQTAAMAVKLILALDHIPAPETETPEAEVKRRCENCQYALIVEDIEPCYSCVENDDLPNFTIKSGRE